MTIDTIAEVVAGYYHVKPVEMRGKRRLGSFVRARHMAMFLARRHTRLSLEEIGRYFGHRDHSTVWYAVDEVGRAAAGGDPETPAHVAHLNAELLRRAAAMDAA